MAAIPENISNLPIPTAMLELVENGHWPAGQRVDTSPVANEASCEFLGGIDLDFLPSADSMERELDSLAKLAGGELYKVYVGSELGECVDLPWLDVEKAVCIGSGADYGDDLWLMLDYRKDKDNPCVVANEITAQDDVYWRMVAPSFSAFSQVIGLADGSWRPGRYGSSKFSVFYEPPKPWWKFW